MMTSVQSNVGRAACSFARRWVPLLAASALLFPAAASRAGTTHPYYLRPKHQTFDPALFATDRVDFRNVHLPPYVNTTESVNVAAFANLFDGRAAAVVARATGGTNGVVARSLLDEKDFDGAIAPILVPTARCLALMAYHDFFPGYADYLTNVVSEALLAAKAGWAGTFGAGVNTLEAILGGAAEGNYDFTQMYLISLVYRYYDDLTPDAREHLIEELLQKGHIQRPGHDETFTSGAVPVDWPRAGTVKVPGVGTTLREIGETENHILMILTARYFANQLLYQRTHLPVHDNRRNGSNGGPACTDLVLSLLRNILRDDFSEYNAKNYQTETRWALLNLSTYAYDHEVRLAARMVLDYVSAHMAVSSSDNRRMVPFRRRNEDYKNRTMRSPNEGFMAVGLLEWQMGSDPMPRFLALITGNTRPYEIPNYMLSFEDGKEVRPYFWGLADDGLELLLDATTDYRLPPSIHDLFVNDEHRRFFQRLHRTPRPEEQGGNRTGNDKEIFAASASYLISAGGEPATWAIDPTLALGIALPGQDKQLGVAVTTSFMPTGQSAGIDTQNSARDLIQFGSFSQDVGKVANYGVAPDFAFGYKVYLPGWVTFNAEPPTGKFLFVNKKGALPNVKNGGPGFYLAIYRNGDFALMEAFDTWLYPDLTYDQFKASVLARNPNLNLENGVDAQYTTQNGNRIHFRILKLEDGWHYSEVLKIDYGPGDPHKTLIDAGNDSMPFLSGTIMTSPREAVVEIRNPFLETRITLDMSDKSHPKRIDEKGVVEQAGFNHEVWVDFEWTGPSEGDFYRPFKTLATAVAAVADGGVIRIMSGVSAETPTLAGKRITLLAPAGGVTIGAR